MRTLLLLSLAALVVLAVASSNAIAAGISVDAGLTPAEDRWILRSQVRYMRRNNDPTPMDRRMNMYAFPAVVAYGLRPDFTLMVRQVVKHMDMSMAGSRSRTTGLDDLFILGKYKLYRRNTPQYTFGIATTLGLEIPTGTNSFSSGTWDAQPGLYTSWRSGPWAADFNVAYSWNGFADRDESGVNPGDELSLDWALAYQLSIGDNARVTLAPVLELSYRNISSDRQGGLDVANTGESVLYLSPGAKLTVSSFILEALLQIPVWQDQQGLQLDRNLGFILGSRYMF
ncbi:MAG: transporter [Phycisphaerales bacterium]|nr:MAG: transporter [Phycisphaerales bacterium]